MSVTRSVVVTGVAVVASAVSVTLIFLLVTDDKQGTAEVATVVGTIAALVTLVLAVVDLLRGVGGSAPRSVRRARASRGGAAFAGDIIGSAVGDRSTVKGGRPAPTRSSRSGQSDTRATRDGRAFGGDVVDSALGDESSREL